MNQHPQLPDMSLTVPLQPSPSTIISIMRGQVHLPISKIIRLEGDRNYTRFVLADGRRILTCQNLGFYEMLLPNIFVRIHKRYLLNLAHISSLVKFQVRMTDGFEVTIARRKKSKLVLTISTWKIH